MNKKMNVNCDRPIMRKAGTRLAGLNLELILPWPVSHFINHTSSSSLVPVFEQIIWIYKFKSVFYQTLMTNFGALFGMISPHFDIWKILHIDLDYLVFDQFVLANNIWVFDMVQYLVFVHTLSPTPMHTLRKLIFVRLDTATQSQISSSCSFQSQLYKNILMFNNKLKRFYCLGSFMIHLLSPVHY